jgi:hypothetical protein
MLEAIPFMGEGALFMWLQYQIVWLIVGLTLTTVFFRVRSALRRDKSKTTIAFFHPYWYVFLFGPGYFDLFWSLENKDYCFLAFY